MTDLSAQLHRQEADDDDDDDEQVDMVVSSAKQLRLWIVFVCFNN